MFIVQMVKKKSIKLLNSDFEDMANKDIEDMVLLDNSSKYIMKDYLVVSLDTKVEVLEVMDDDEVKYEVKECGKELQVDFIGTKSIILNRNFSLACTHHKLKFEVQESKTCNFVNILAQCYIRNICFLGVEEFNF